MTLCWCRGSGWSHLVSQCQLVAQTCPGQSCHVKQSQTEFEPNQTNTNGFNRFWFQFQKFWLKPNSLVSSLGKNGLNQTKPNFPNTTWSLSPCWGAGRGRKVKVDKGQVAHMGWNQPWLCNMSGIQSKKRGTKTQKWGGSGWIKRSWQC